jgi:hypothetical protein
MNQSQRLRLVGRDRGQRRVTHVTRGIAAGGALTAAVITMVLAQGPASAASTTTDPITTAQSAGLGSQSAPQDGQQNGDQGLQPPVVAPSHSHSASSHTRSGAS